MWVEIGIDCCIPHRKLQLNPHSSPRFTPSCDIAIADRNHYFHQYHQNATPENKKLFCDSRNHCKSVLKDAMSNYVVATHRSFASQLIGFQDFWGICNSVFNGTEVLATSTDKANLFARNISCNSTLDDGSQQLPDFPSRTDLALRISLPK